MEYHGGGKTCVVMSFKLRSLNDILVEPMLLGARAVTVYAVTAFFMQLLLFYSVNACHSVLVAAGKHRLRRDGIDLWI